MVYSFGAPYGGYLIWGGLDWIIVDALWDQDFCLTYDPTFSLEAARPGSLIFQEGKCIEGDYYIARSSVFNMDLFHSAWRGLELGPELWIPDDPGWLSALSSWQWNVHGYDQNLDAHPSFVVEHDSRSLWFRKSVAWMFLFGDDQHSTTILWC